MQARVQKWGNSLALRIPKAFAAEARLAQDTLVDIALEGDTLVVRPVAEQRYDLDALLAGVTPENIHGEVSTGEPVGNEEW